MSLDLKQIFIALENQTPLYIFTSFEPQQIVYDYYKYLAKQHHFDIDEYIKFIIVQKQNPKENLFEILNTKNDFKKVLMHSILLNYETESIFCRLFMIKY